MSPWSGLTSSSWRQFFAWICLISNRFCRFRIWFIWSVAFNLAELPVLQKPEIPWLEVHQSRRWSMPPPAIIDFRVANGCYFLKLHAWSRRFLRALQRFYPKAWWIGLCQYQGDDWIPKIPRMHAMSQNVWGVGRHSETWTCTRIWRVSFLGNQVHNLSQIQQLFIKLVPPGLGPFFYWLERLATKKCLYIACSQYFEIFSLQRT